MGVSAEFVMIAMVWAVGSERFRDFVEVCRCNNLERRLPCELRSIQASRALFASPKGTKLYSLLSGTLNHSIGMPFSLGMQMEDQNIEFVVFPHDDVWKLYREEELVCVYNSKRDAEEAAKGFVSSIRDHAKLAKIRVFATTEAARDHGLKIDL